MVEKTILFPNEPPLCQALFKCVLFITFFLKGPTKLSQNKVHTFFLKMSTSISNVTKTRKEA